MGRMRNTFFRLTIANKLLIGYLSLALLFVGTSVFTLTILKRLEGINEGILSTDVPVAETADKMIENILAQEVYAHRYAILKSPDMLELYLQRGDEFTGLLGAMEKIPNHQNLPIERLTALHEEYRNLFRKGISGLGENSTVFPKSLDEAVKQVQGKLIDVIKNMSFNARMHQSEMTRLTSEMGSTAIRLTALLCILGLLLGLGSALMIKRNIYGSISQLKRATEQISMGKFDETPEVESRDELGELSGSFRQMAQRLKRLGELYLDANPLTKLPGSVTIEKILDQRIEEKNPLAFCLVDMDNFKAYNDRYGYARGSNLIIATAQIVRRVVEEKGTEDDFFGHIGGDDFVIITVPERYRVLCDSIIREFDEKVPEHYDEEDRKRRFIAARSRQGTPTQFPLITVSIAVVTNEKRTLLNHIQVGEIAAELKDYAKSMPGSQYVVDQRREYITERRKKSQVIRFPES